MTLMISSPLFRAFDFEILMTVYANICPIFHLNHLKLPTVFHKNLEFSSELQRNIRFSAECNVIYLPVKIPYDNSLKACQKTQLVTFDS